MKQHILQILLHDNVENGKCAQIVKDPHLANFLTVQASFLPLVVDANLHAE
jgi:hypothetical protein